MGFDVWVGCKYMLYQERQAAKRYQSGHCQSFVSHLLPANSNSGSLAIFTAILRASAKLPGYYAYQPGVWRDWR